MRIAIIGKKFPFCGIVTYCRELIAGLRAAGHTVAFYYMHNGEVAAEEDGLPYWLRTHMYVVPAHGARDRLAASLAGFRPDVVHASFALSLLDFALPEICAELGVPLVATFHVAFDDRLTLPNQVSAWTYRLYAPTLARAAAVIVFSEAQKERLAALGVAASRVRVLPNGVDTARYRPGPSTFKRRLGADTLVTYMGRLDPEKNVGTLLRAFTRLPPRPGVKLAVMGDGLLANRLRARYAGHPAIAWLGYVADEALRIDVLRGTDLFVLPSSVEGLSLALLEAMACGAAPLATDVGADGELVGGCGRVLGLRHLRAELAHALGDLLDDPAGTARLGALARRRVVEGYGYGRNLSELLGLYEACRFRARATG